MATRKSPGRKKVAGSSSKSAPKKSTLHKFVTELKTHAQTAKAKGAPVGACDVTNAHTGGTSCILTDAATCTSLGGNFRGGPCG